MTTNLRKRRYVALAANTFTAACAVYVVMASMDGPLWYLVFCATVNALLVGHLVTRLRGLRALDRLMRSPFAYLYLVRHELGGAK